MEIFILDHQAHWMAQKQRSIPNPWDQILSPPPQLFFFFFFVRLKCNFHPLRFRVGLLIFKIYKNNSYNNIKVSIPLYLLYFCHNPPIIFFFLIQNNIVYAGLAQGILEFKAIILSVNVCKRFRIHMEKSKQSKIKIR